MTADDLMERLAAIEHERWADWQSYLFARCGPSPIEADPDARLIWGVDARHWQRQIDTPYDQLSEAEKQSDREQVMRYWPLLVEFVAEWIGDNLQWDEERLGERWLNEVVAPGDPDARPRRSPQV